MNVSNRIRGLPKSATFVLAVLTAADRIYFYICVRNLIINWRCVG